MTDGGRRCTVKRSKVRPSVISLCVLVVMVSAPMAVASVAYGATNPRVVVPVAVIGGQGTQGGANPIVEVKVGNWGPVPVLLDTGSSGLHIFAGAVNGGSGVAVTTQKSDITYAGGYRFDGLVASGVVTLGTQATAGPASFALVYKASCTASKPGCAASGGIAGFESDRGVDGILGIGTESSGGGIISPILGMPGALGDTWSLHLDGTSGRLTLGAAIPTGRRAKVTIDMKSDGSAGGPKLWADDRLPLCVTGGPERECVHGLFDSGTPSTQISGPELDQVPTEIGTSQVLAGTPMTVATLGASSPFWSFTAGTTKSSDLVRVMDGQGPFFNSGVEAFYDFTITYDDATGSITLGG
jgi:hypothetical protein